MSKKHFDGNLPKSCSFTICVDENTGELVAKVNGKCPPKTIAKMVNAMVTHGISARELVAQCRVDGSQPDAAEDLPKAEKPIKEEDNN